ncbi:hypothetical protein [Mucilaginibacter aquaedulcis]|uniref:hypothetical protein n=1 Tax=Mucilaginibacter aquaedulcis TaxID=1187081 RepID=UPI0025B4A3C7|nr:hypothetical protein [Mucilaginibacter aquaedulcis]MDN3548778.1 hypothetical protein [Mucilaginibacter aquaedulcis]
MKNKIIDTYIINLRSRIERKEHILNEFKTREEFAVNIVEACEHKIGAVGLWNSIKKIIREAERKELEYVLICEDDHLFTSDYSKDILFERIAYSIDKNADILSGGVSWFEDALYIADGIFWVRKFSGAQFTIIFKKFYRIILEATFEDTDAADYKMGTLTNNKFFIYPFISVQQEFGYSDVTDKNNEPGHVVDLFKRSSASALVVKSIRERSKKSMVDMPYNDTFENITIPTYIINLPESRDRRRHIEQQFEGRSEFDVKIIAAVKHEIGAVGLWLSIRNVIEMAVENDDDVIIICEDDHEFTMDYTKNALLQNIITAHKQRIDYLSGGAGNFGLAIPVTTNSYWVNPCFSTQFIVVYKSLFQKILNHPFDENVRADILLSNITFNKLILYPYISTQKDFGHSYVTPIHNSSRDFVKNMFTNAANRLEAIKTAYLNYDQ